MTTHETHLRMRYAETDQMGVVYYSNYFIWMELGRAEYCRAMGLRYKDMEATDGILLAVVDAHCRYLSPARYDEEIAVTTWIGMSNPRTVEFKYEIRDLLTSRRLGWGAGIEPTSDCVRTKKVLPAFNLKSRNCAALSRSVRR